MAVGVVRGQPPLERMIGEPLTEQPAPQQVRHGLISACAHHSDTFPGLEPIGMQEGEHIKLTAENAGRLGRKTKSSH